MKTEMPDILAVMKKVKSSTVEVKLCPRCLDKYFTPYGRTYVEFVSPPMPALSRRDNKTHICSDCGQQEALEDNHLIAPWVEHKYWLD
jgi:transcription elongation factor Elf1